MLKNIITGIAIGLATLWLWDRWQQSNADAIGGGSIIARVRRMFNTPTETEDQFPVNAAVSAAGIDPGGCGCSS